MMRHANEVRMRVESLPEWVFYMPEPGHEEPEQHEPAVDVEAELILHNARKGPYRHLTGWQLCASGRPTGNGVDGYANLKPSVPAHTGFFGDIADMVVDDIVASKDLLVPTLAPNHTHNLAQTVMQGRVAIAALDRFLLRGFVEPAHYSTTGLFSGTYEPDGQGLELLMGALAVGRAQYHHSTEEEDQDAVQRYFCMLRRSMESHVSELELHNSYQGVAEHYDGLFTRQFGVDSFNSLWAGFTVVQAETMIPFLACSTNLIKNEMLHVLVPVLERQGYDTTAYEP